jgi:hypothetical protein
MNEELKSGWCSEFGMPPEEVMFNELKSKLIRALTENAKNSTILPTVFGLSEVDADKITQSVKKVFIELCDNPDNSTKTKDLTKVFENVSTINELVYATMLYSSVLERFAKDDKDTSKDLLNLLLLTKLLK